MKDKPTVLKDSGKSKPASQWSPVSLAHPARAIAQCQCPGRARWPASPAASPAASHAHTTLLGASGARRCGSLDCAPWSLRASSTRPRASTAAAAPELRGACGRAACAPRRSVRAAASRSSPRSRACPPRMRRSRSGRRPVKRGGRNERLDGQGRVSGRKERR